MRLHDGRRWTNESRPAAAGPVPIKASDRTGVTATTITKFEEGKQRPPMLDVSVVRRKLSDAGVEFVDGEPGVRLRKA
jgi:hypothetical protein